MAKDTKTASLSEDDHDVLDYYLNVCELLKRLPQGLDPEGAPPANAQEVKMLAARFSHCRLFSFPSQFFREMTKAAYHEVYQKLANVLEKGEEGQEDDEELEAEAEKKFFAVADAGSKVKFPDRLPFDDCAIIYGNGITLPPIILSLRIPQKAIDAQEITEGVLHAHIVFGKEQRVWELLSVWRKEGSRKFGLAPVELYRPGPVARVIMSKEGRTMAVTGWAYGYTLMPWVINGVVDAINENRKSILPVGPMTMRQAWKKVTKSRKTRTRESPPAFYPIILNPDTAAAYCQAKIRSMVPKDITYSHRWDVMGHERLKIRRGLLPLDPVIEEKLFDRGYLIHEGTLSDEDATRLAKRGIEPKSEYEWVALKVINVSPHVRGPEDKPYVPAMRILRGDRDGRTDEARLAEVHDGQVGGQDAEPGGQVPGG